MTYTEKIIPTEEEPVQKALVLEGVSHLGGDHYLDVQALIKLRILFNYEPNPGYIEGVEGANPYRHIQFKSVEEIQMLAEEHGFLFVSDPNWTDTLDWSEEEKQMVWAPPKKAFYRFVKKEGGPAIVTGVTVEEVNAQPIDKRSLLDMLEPFSQEDVEPKTNDKLFYQVLIEDMAGITSSKLEEWKDWIGKSVSFITQLLRTGSQENKGRAVHDAYMLINETQALCAEDEGVEKAKEAIKNTRGLEGKDPDTVIFYALAYVLRDFVETHFGSYETEMFDNARMRIMQRSRSMSLDNTYLFDIDVERALCTSVQ